jgi:hypothetical protein
MLARQMLYHLSHFPSPVACFSDRVWHFLLLALDHDLPVPTPGVAGITDVIYHTWPLRTFLNMPSYDSCFHFCQ